MKKSELIEQLSQQQSENNNKQLIGPAVNVLLDQISTALSSGQRVEIRGFGSFSLRHWGPRFARNPKTGETWLTEPSTAIHFKAGQDLREQVNQTQSFQVDDSESE